MKKLLDYEFEYVQDLKPVVDNKGNIKEYYPHENYTLKELELHKYGKGPFCKFSINPKWSNVSGVYALYIEDKLVYIGQAIDFAKRFNIGYGKISPRNCFVGGQSTNCKINNVVLNSVKEGKTVSLYFHQTNDFYQIEFNLIKQYKPEFNSSLNNENIKKPVKNSISNKPRITKTNKATNNPTISEVREYIKMQINHAKDNKENELILQSGTIHKNLNMVNTMPTVCSAMRTLGDDYIYEILEQPPKGNGSRLIFRYIL